jgi:hypothetical protein
MQDPYAGQAGTYVTDPDKGVRVPIEQWQAEQQAAKENGQAKAKPTKNEPAQPEAN